MCHTPIVIRGHPFTLSFFFNEMIMIIIKKWCWHDQLMLLEQILTPLRHPVASWKAMNLLHQAVCAVLYWNTATVIRMVNKVGVFFHHCCFACNPGSCRHNTEWVVAHWQRPEASGVALDMLHWAMPCLLLNCICLAIKMTRNRGSFVGNNCDHVMVDSNNQQATLLLFKYYWLAHILWSSTSDNGCRLGHHCCLWTRQILTTHRGKYK